MNRPVRPQGHMQAPLRWGALYALSAGLAAALPFLPRHLPTLDGPQHLRLASFLIEMRADPGSPLHGVYEDALRLRTASLFAWYAQATHALFDIETAERCWLALAIAGFALAGWLWTRAIRPAEPARALLVAPFFINWFTTQGFLPFLASVPLGAIALWLLVGDPGDTRATRAARVTRVLRPLAAAVLLVLCYLGHLATLLLVAGAAVLLAFARGPDRRLRRTLLVLLPSLPALLLALAASRRDFSVTVSSHGTPPFGAPHFASLPELFAYTIMRTQADVGPVDRWLQRASIALFAVLLALAVRALIQPHRGEARALALSLPRSAWPLGALLLLMLAFAFLPVGAAGGWHVSARLIPFMFLLVPSAAWWPAAGSAAERRLAGAAAALSLTISLGVGASWRVLGEHLGAVAASARVMERGARVLPLVFHPGDELSFTVRHTALLRHAWALPARTRRLLVPFGFENLRHSMARARPDANPPLPDGPNEFAASKLWGEPLRDPPHVLVESGLDTEELTDAARLYAGALAAPDFLAHVRDAVLARAERDFHYLLVVHPPAAIHAWARARGWPLLYAQDGVEVYRMALPLDRLALPYGHPAH